MGVLGQVNASPILPVDVGGRPTWAQAKAFWFDRLGYKIYADEVLRFHQSEARVRIPLAPARTSKSYSATFDLIPFALPTDPPCDSLIWLVGPNFAVNKEWEYVNDIFVRDRHHFATPGGSVYQIERHVSNVRAGDLELRFVKQRDPKTGRRYRTIIKGMSAENEKALQGEEVTLAVMSEAAEHPAHILPKYIGTRAHWIVCPTTPKPKADWLRKMVEDGDQDPRLGIESFQFPPHANPTYNHKRFEMERAAAELRAKAQIGDHATAEDDPLFAEQFLGRFVYYTGRVLPISAARNVIDPSAARAWLPESRIMVSVDYGYNDPACALFWAVLPNGILVLFDEIYERGLETGAFIDRIHQRLASYELIPEYVCGDPSRPEVDRVMRESGLNVFVMDRNAQRDRAAGTRRLIDLLVSGPVEGYPGLYVTKNCHRTLAEWNALHFREGCTNEYSTSAWRGADHAADAARYFVMTRPSPRPDPEPEDEVGRFIRERKREATRQSKLKRMRYAA